MERDYGVWKFSGKEKAKLILSYLGLCGLVSWLFYHSFWAVLPFLAGLPVFLKKSREKRIKERREELRTEFLTGIRAIASALDAGYSIENALGEALKETEKVYGMDGVFTEELREMERKRNLNQNEKRNRTHNLLLHFFRRQADLDLPSCLCLPGDIVRRTLDNLL